MTDHKNPALRQESRHQPITVVPPLPRETLLDWLDRTGRLRSHTLEENGLAKIDSDIDSILDPEAYALDIEDEDDSDDEID